jgi:hypothetical protein
MRSQVRPAPQYIKSLHAFMQRCACMYVCMYVCMCVCVCVCVHDYICMCVYVRRAGEGSRTRGTEMGVHPYGRMSRSAKRKLRKSEASNKSCRNRR